jgi:hypothetical protein
MYDAVPSALVWRILPAVRRKEWGRKLPFLCYSVGLHGNASGLTVGRCTFWIWVVVSWRKVLVVLLCQVTQISGQNPPVLRPRPALIIPDYCLLLFHGNSGYANVPKCNVIGTLPILLIFKPWERRTLETACLFFSALLSVRHPSVLS